MARFILFLKSIFLNPAIWFLIILSAVIIFWSYSLINNSPNNASTVNQIQLGNQEAQTITVRVLNSKDSSFGLKEYSVLWNNQTWLVKNTLANLKIGFEYQLETKSIQNYSQTIQTSSFDRYNYSLGIQGEIKSVSKTQLINCDFICFLASSLGQIQINLKNQLLLNNCHNNYFVITALGQDAETCRTISYLGYGLILGGSNNLGSDFKASIKKVGLTHLIAFSGFQVVIICSLLELILTQINISRFSKILITILFLAVTIILVGPQPPVLRSSLSLLTLEIILFAFGKKISAVHRLVYSSLILLILNPFYLINLSFQLSILATMGLILGSSLLNKPKKPKKSIKPNLNDFIKELVVQTAGAWLLTLPITIILNGQINLLQIISNILIVPIIPFSSLLILLTTIPFLGWLFGFLNTLVLTSLQILINDLAQINQFVFVFKSSLLPIDLIVYYFLILIIWSVIYSQKYSQKKLATES